MQLQSSNKDTLVIEDTGNGVIGAQMAGFKTLAVGNRWEDTQPDLTRDDLFDLDPEALLLQITSPTQQHSPTH
jgi:beta-phosphoglucomutase-like phosphatase (HAD superfamily)